MDYVIRIPGRKRNYYYFRYGVDGNGRGGSRVPLPGAPGSREFETRYEALKAEHFPQPIAVGDNGFPVGSLGWAIAEYRAKSSRWKRAKPSSREIYERRFAWLRENFGPAPLAAFDEDLVREIRDMPEFAHKPSVADMTVERLGHIWDYAKERLRAHVKLNGLNPARGVAKAQEGEGESAPLWPRKLCEQFEQLEDRSLVTFYYLARYTGQRRSDLAKMKWEHIAGDEMFVAQIKTDARIWVPMPKPLRDYLASWPETGPYIVMSPKLPGKPWRETSITNEIKKATAKLGFMTTDSKGARRGYSPHGLRHLCGVELSLSGATAEQVAAVLGHASTRQASLYMKQADQRLLARGGQAKRDTMYERERREAAIDAADNVARLRTWGGGR
jgi:integrase